MIVAGFVIVLVCAIALSCYLKGDIVIAKEFALGVGIAILVPLVIYYGVCTFSPPPRWEDYRVKELQRSEKLSPGEHEQYMEQQQALDDARRAHRLHFEKIYFSVAVPLGIAAIVIGTFLAMQAIGTGLMFGGILSLTHGYLIYWKELPDWIRFVSVLVALVILVFVGYRRFGRQSGTA